MFTYKKLFLALTLGLLIALALARVNGNVLPAKLMIEYSGKPTGYLKAYYNTGKGYNERQTSKSSTFNNRLEIDLPLRKLVSIRLDFEGRRAKEYIVKRTCIVTVFQRRCLTVDALYSDMQFINRIDLGITSSRELRFTIGGADPWFVLPARTVVDHSLLTRLSTSRIILTVAGFTLLLFAILVLEKRLHIFQRILQSVKEYYDVGLPFKTGEISVWFILISIFLGSFWQGLSDSYYAIFLLCFGLTVCIFLDRWSHVFRLSTGVKKRATTLQNKFYFRDGIVVTLIAILPVFLLLSLTWNQEFPHIGDHHYHTWANKLAAIFYSKQEFIYSSALLITLFAVLTGFTKLSALSFLIFLGWGASQLEIHEIFTRYPGFGRMLAWPFVELADAFDWSSRSNAGRLANTLSIPVWLLVLRPLFLGRMPDRLILAVVCIVYYQLEVVYYATTVYLDAWAMVFVLLALELLLCGRHRFSALFACMLLGFGSLIKEPLIFLVPWFWFCSRPWRFNLQDRIVAVQFGVASVLPFLVYFLIRRGTGFSRYHYSGFEQLLIDSWQNEFLYKMGWHLGFSGSLMLALLGASWLISFKSITLKSYRLKLSMVLGAISTLFLLFNLDQGGNSFTGYTRFYLPIFILLCAPLFLLANWVSVDVSQRRRYFIIVPLVACALNFPALGSYFKKTMGPDELRNFTEHYDAPIYLPIKKLIAKAEKFKKLQAGDQIYINHITGWNQPVFVYSDLSERYKLLVDKNIRCACTKDFPVVLATYVYPAGLHQGRDITDPTTPGHPRLPRIYPKRWKEVNQGKVSCIKKLRQSCRYTTSEEIDGFITGIIGVK